MRLLGRALTQSDGCPYKKGKSGHTKGHQGCCCIRTHREKRHPGVSLHAGTTPGRWRAIREPREKPTLPAPGSLTFGLQNLEVTNFCC